MAIIKTKQVTDVYGLAKILYKEGRKTLAEIGLPNKYNGYKYRTHIHITKCGGVGGSFNTLEDAQNVMCKYFEGVFFGNVIITSC